MADSDCPMLINNLSLSKIVDFEQVKNCVEMKKKQIERHDKNFFGEG